MFGSSIVESRGFVPVSTQNPAAQTAADSRLDCDKNEANHVRIAQANCQLEGNLGISGP